MKKLSVVIAAFAFLFSSLSVKADQFNFSYTFGSGDIVTGSLNGTQNGLFVENISNVSVSFNGILFAGAPNLYQFGWIPECCFTTSVPAVVSFNGNLNNFGFWDSPIISSSIAPPATNWFAMQAVNGPYQNASVYFGGLYSSDVSLNGSQVISPEIQGAFNAANWVLTPVPEPETYAMLLAGLCMLGFAARRRKLKEAAAA